MWRPLGLQSSSSRKAALIPRTPDTALRDPSAGRGASTGFSAPSACSSIT